MNNSVVSVAFPIAIDGFYDYRIPSRYIGSIAPGVPVLVSLRSRQIWGMAVALKESSSFGELKEVLDARPGSSIESRSALITLYHWIADYYHCEVGKVFKPFIRSKIMDTQVKRVAVYTFGIPSGLVEDLTPKQAEALQKIRAFDGELLGSVLGTMGIGAHIVAALCKKNILVKTQKAVLRESVEMIRAEKTDTVILTDQQNAAVASILESIDNPSKPFLLFGITGSGKTHVYIAVAQEVRKRGRGVILLVPEISLTPQTISRFKSALGDDIAVIHSRMSDGERRDSLEELMTGRKRIVIGVRSAILAPVEDVGLILVDEEHDGSYKQSDIDPRYNARDVAVMRGKFSRALVVLGSATPSIESYYNARAGKYILITLTARFGAATLPVVAIADMAAENREKNWTTLSRYLQQRMVQALSAGRQIILLINRRGFSTVLVCKDCNHAYVCSGCSVNLIYHRAELILKCHQCGYQEPAPTRCSRCHGEHIKYTGFGIQKVEEYLIEQFPGVRILRMDQDTTRRKGSHVDIIEQFAARKADILLGTQMVAKGLNFHDVSLVGVLQADIGLHFPDFRATEKTFQLLTQVAGRAGRSDSLGEVVIQTYFPEEPGIIYAQNHDFEGFFGFEIEQRKALGYPPFGKLARIVASGTVDTAVRQAIERIAVYIKNQVDIKYGPALEFRGPAPAVIEKIDNRYRYHLLLKSPSPATLNAVVRGLKPFLANATRAGVKVIVDIDPVNMM